MLLTHRRLAVIPFFACSLAVSRSAGGQIDTSEHTRVYVTPYGWLSGLTGDLGVRDLAVHVDVPFADVLKALKFAATGTVEVRRGPWLGSVDVIYVSLAAGKTVAIRGDTGSFELKQRETILQPMAGYTVGNAQWAVDLLAGLRYWNLGTTLDTERPRATNERSGDRGWVDALGGARFRIMPAERVHLALGADAGGGGSKGTWQVVGSAGFDLSSTITAGIAYRYLAVNYDHDNVLFDVATHGPALGLMFRF